MRNHRFIVGKGVHRDIISRFIKCCGCWQCTIAFNRQKIQYFEHTKLLKPTSYPHHTLCSRYHKTAISSQIEFSLYGFGYLMALFLSSVFKLLFFF